MPNWEVFTKRGSTTALDARVTLHKSGSLAMSKPAYDLLGGPSWVELLYDRDEQIIGIRRTDEGTPHAYPLRHTDANPGQWLMSGLAFMKFYGLLSNVTRRFPAYLDEGVLCVDLKTSAQRLIGNRSNGHEEAVL